MKQLYEKHSELIKNYFWRSSQIVFKQGIVFLIFFIAAKFLMPSDFGLLNYLMALLALLMIFCDFGISVATSKYVAEYRAKKSVHLNKILFSVSSIIVLIALIVSLFILVFGKYIFSDYKLMMYFIPYLFFLPLTSVLDGIYRGMKDFKKLSIVTMIVGMASLVSSYFLISKLYLIGAILSQNLLYVLLALSLFVLRKETRYSIDREVLRKVINYAIIIGFANIAFFMYTKADIIILKHFGFIIEIGYYEIINKLFALLIMPALIFGQVVAPNMTKLYVMKRVDLLRSKFNKYFILWIIIGAAISLIAYILFPSFIAAFLPGYNTPIIMLMMNLLLITLFLKLVAGVTTQGFTIPCGFAKLNMLILFVMGPTNIILDLLLIEKYGFIGVIYATMIVVSISTILLISIFYSRYLHRFTLRSFMMIIWMFYEIVGSILSYIVFKPLLLLSRVFGKTFYGFTSILFIKICNVVFFYNNWREKRANKIKYDARKYRDTYDKNISLYLKAFDHTKLFLNKNVLDVGCGLGGKDLAIYEKFHPKRILGVDMSCRNIGFANEIKPKKQKILEFKNIDVLKLNKKNYFDTIISYTAFEHIDKKQILSILNKFAELLKENGVIVIVFNHYNDRFGSHLKEYIYHPWPQSLFDENILFKYWNESLMTDKNIGEDSYFPKSYKHGLDVHNYDCFMNLNKLSIPDFEKIALKSKLKLMKKIYYSRSPFLSLFPFLPKKYLIGSCIYCLKNPK